MPPANFANDVYFQAILLTCIAYGSIVTLSLQCIFMLYPRITRSRMMKELPLLIYVTLVFMLSTIFQGAAMVIAQKSFVNIPGLTDGESGAYESSNFSIHVNVLANATLITLCFLSDLLLLWRCTVVYRDLYSPGWVNGSIACALWLTEFALGTVLLIQISRPGGSLPGSMNFNLAFWGVSLAVNVLATILIVGRILYCRWCVWMVCKHTSDSTYTSAIAMIIESEMIYAVILILYIVFTVRGSALLPLVQQPIAHVQAAATLLIVYRVVQGKAWSKETYKQMMARGSAMSDIKFDTVSTTPDVVSHSHVGDSEVGASEDTIIIFGDSLAKKE